MSTPAPSLQQLKAAMRATWMAGNFGAVAKSNRESGAAFAERLQISAATRVLDVACGTGNVTIPLARQGVAVTGLDIAPNLLVEAREWAESENLTIPFDEGDAEELPYADGSFDAVVTMFGAMFTPRPEVVAAELARVLKPGGLLAMGNWTPASFTAQMMQVSSRHAPPPAGVPAPALWGDAATARERLQPYFADIKTEVVAMDFDLPMDSAGAVVFFRENFGPAIMTFRRLDEAGRAALEADLEVLWSDANVAPDPTKRTLVRNQYLQVLGRRV